MSLEINTIVMAQLALEKNPPPPPPGRPSHTPRKTRRTHNQIGRYQYVQMDPETLQVIRIWPSTQQAALQAEPKTPGGAVNASGIRGVVTSTRTSGGWRWKRQPNPDFVALTNEKNRKL